MSPSPRSQNAPEVSRHVDVELPRTVARTLRDLEAQQLEEGLQRDAHARVDACRLEAEGGQSHTARNREGEDARCGMAHVGGLDEGRDRRLRRYATEATEGEG